MSTLTQEQRLSRARVSVMRNERWQYLSGILMLGTHTIKDDVPTAYTNGRDVVYGRAFITGITDRQLEGLVLHEALHIMFKHLLTWQGLFKEDVNRANRACDYVINLLIVDSGFELPPNPCLSEDFRGMDARQVFELLGKDEASGETKYGSGEVMDEHDWEAAQDMSSEELKGLTKEIDAALREGALLASRNKGGAPRELTDLLKPQVDWKEVVREFITSHVKGNSYATWRRPSRRHIASGLYLPSQLSDSMEHLLMGVDTSGSVSNKAMVACVSEVQGAVDAAPPERLDIMYWGSDVAGHEVYEGEQVRDFASKTKPIAGGGTDVGELFRTIERLKLEPQCVVVLTDGFTPWPSKVPTYPVLFVMTTDVVAPFGKTVRIEV